MGTAIVLADGGPEIGLGHLRRCLVLSTALTRHGWTVQLLVPDEGGRSLARHADVEAAPWPAELHELPAADLLVADSYRIDRPLCLAWKDRFAARVHLDDLADRPLDAELIVNPNIYGPELDYSGICDCPILAGLRYCLVDPAFAALRHRPRPQPPRVLVAFGGSDDGRLGAALAESLLIWTDAGIDLVISPLRRPAPVATELVWQNSERLTLHHGPRMLELMARATVYAGACGSTVWEAAAAGVPVVVCQTAENQRIIRASLEKRGVAAFATCQPARLARAAADLLAAPSVNPLAGDLDGRGADRVSAACLRLLGRQTHEEMVDDPR